MAKTNIINNVWLGSWKDALDCNRDVGKWNVITVADDAHVIGNHHFPISDPGLEDADFTHYQNAVACVAQAAKESRSVLVSCQSGVNRSPAVVIGYLMQLFGGDIARAHNYVIARRKHIKPCDKQLEFALALSNDFEPLDRSGFEEPALTDIEIAINEAYQKYLGRKADPDGLDHYSRKIENKDMTIAELERTLANSAESKPKEVTDARESRGEAISGPVKASPRRRK